jgi:hypothetical protein
VALAEPGSARSAEVSAQRRSDIVEKLSSKRIELCRI